jgi:hypothetical protein
MRHASGNKDVESELVAGLAMTSGNPMLGLEVRLLVMPTVNATAVKRSIPEAGVGLYAGETIPTLSNVQSTRIVCAWTADNEARSNAAMDAIIVFFILNLFK